jgi:hypothetical protein
MEYTKIGNFFLRSDPEFRLFSVDNIEIVLVTRIMNEEIMGEWSDSF